MSAPRLEGKVALITGAAGGIGAASARRFAAEGALVLLTDADADGAERLQAELGDRASAHEHDVSSEEGWREAVAWALETHGRIDVLLNNAGIFLAAPLADTSLEEFRRVIDVNVVGVFLGMRAVAPAMSERRAGSIVNVSSVAGLTGSPMLTAYAASKWAVRGMTKVLAKELARFGVRVNSLHPGQIDTDMNARQRERTPELVDRSADPGNTVAAHRYPTGGCRGRRVSRLRRERLRDRRRAGDRWGHERMIFAAADPDSLERSP